MIQTRKTKIVVGPWPLEFKFMITLCCFIFGRITQKGSYQNAHNIVLVPYIKSCIECLMQVTHTYTHTHQCYKKSCSPGFKVKFLWNINQWITWIHSWVQKYCTAFLNPHQSTIFWNFNMLSFFNFKPIHFPWKYHQKTLFREHKTFYISYWINNSEKQT